MVGGARRIRGVLVRQGHPNVPSLFRAEVVRVSPCVVVVLRAFSCEQWEFILGFVLTICPDVHREDVRFKRQGQSTLIVNRNTLIELRGRAPHKFTRLVRDLRRGPTTRGHGRTVELIFVDLRVRNHARCHCVLFVRFCGREFFFVFDRLRVDFTVRMGLPIFPVRANQVLRHHYDVRCSFYSVEGSCHVNAPSFPGVCLIVCCVFFHRMEEFCLSVGYVGSPAWSSDRCSSHYVFCP